MPPIEVGLSSSQQDSFEQHEELSKLLHETDVFYVPLRNDFGDNDLNTNQDITKRFDEDLSHKHLIVTFRDIGYSLFLDSVESIPDAYDQSKIRISGKMIVDGICIQFFGCFDYRNDTKNHSDISAHQINGVGRIQLDEEYYRELSLTQTASESNLKEEKVPAEPIIVRKTRQQAAKLKERSTTKTSTSKPKTRSRTISENLLPKSRTSVSTSPPPPLPITNPLPHSSISTTRPRIHSPTHMPYPLRSPRTKQHRTSSPVHSNQSSTSRNSEVHPSLISNAPTAFSEYPQTNSTPTISQPVGPSQSHRVQVMSPPPNFSSAANDPPTLPIQIPSSSNTGPPTASLPQLTNLLPVNQSHSLPTYFFPASSIAYIATPASTNSPSGGPFDLAPFAGSTGVFLFTTSSQHSTQPVHILAPFDHRSLQFAHIAPTSLFVPPPVSPQMSASRTCNILQPPSATESMSSLQNKRHENEDDKLNQQSLQTNKQSTEQLPFKKRRYVGQHTRMPTVHRDDDVVSDECVKK
ncbi:unnamed protein product [Rotaria socialis]|uniref:Uncharacterized protein n=2 Tax=Rotaria socialis TaxID=392032 RepID=A0A818N2S8_9BILA|nr:unnamed protein product [Rotaria socialis]CAF4474443.1 unnamed protein product [Rotaria socialis]